jgi:predicted RNA-binding protein with PIN domain
VDGYNIIYKWARLKKHMLKGDLQQARQLLVDDLENLRTIKGWRIEVVFDGTGRRSTSGGSGGGVLGDGPGRGASNRQFTAADRESTMSVSKYGVRTVFTGAGIEADSYIQSRCARAKNVTQGKFTGSLIVATDDAMIRMAGVNAGAICMSAERFVDQLKAAKSTVAYRVEAAVAMVNGQTRKNSSLAAAAAAPLPEKFTFGGTTTVLMDRFGTNACLVVDKRNLTQAKLAKKLEKQLQLQLQSQLEAVAKYDTNGTHVSNPNITNK